MSRLRLLHDTTIMAALLSVVPTVAAAQSTGPQTTVRAQEISSPEDLFLKICVASDARKDPIIAYAHGAGFTLAVDPKDALEGAFDIAALHHLRDATVEDLCRSGSGRIGTGLRDDGPDKWGFGNC